MVDACKFLRFQQGDYLLRQGERGRVMFIILQGEVAVTVRRNAADHLEEAREMTRRYVHGMASSLGGGVGLCSQGRAAHSLTISHCIYICIYMCIYTYIHDVCYFVCDCRYAADILGEYAMASDAPRTANGVAATGNVETLMLSRTALTELENSRPGVYERVLGVIARRENISRISRKQRGNTAVARPAVSDGGGHSDSTAEARSRGMSAPARSSRGLSLRAPSNQGSGGAERKESLSPVAMEPARLIGGADTARPRVASAHARSVPQAPPRPLTPVLEHGSPLSVGGRGTQIPLGHIPPLKRCILTYQCVDPPAKHEAWG